MRKRSLWLSLLVGSVVVGCDRTESASSSEFDLDARALADASPEADATATASKPTLWSPATARPDSAACTILASSYDQSCTNDIDCVAVGEVWGCAGCACATGAINKRDQETYTRDLAALSPSEGTASCHCPCVPADPPRCCKGLCTNACGGCPSR
jgi:hypothetical protein